MNKKLLWRKVFALFCAMAVLLGLVALPNGAVYAENDEVPAYREVTFSDFGIDDQIVTADNQVRTSLSDAATLDGVAFTGFLQLQLQADMRYSFRIGGKGADNAPDNEQWRGVGLWPEAKNQLAFFYYTDVLTGKGDIAKIPIADYGITYDEATNSFSEFKLRMTFDNIEGTTDMKLTITINDKLAADTVLSEGQTYLGNRLHIWTNGGKTMSVRSTEGEPSEDGDDTPAEFREVTFADFGLDDQIIPGNGQASGVLTGAENLDGVAFTGYLQMGLMADGYHSFRIGGKEGDDNARWSGVGLWTEAANQLSVFYYTAVPLMGVGGDIVKLPIANYDITYDAQTGYSEFKYRVTFDYVEGTNDIKVTISVNDKLAYDGVLNDAQDYFGNELRLWARGDQTITIRSVTENTGGNEDPEQGGTEDEEPAAYREVTFSDFGINDQTVPGDNQVRNSLAGVENLDGIAFTGYLQLQLQADMRYSFRIGGKGADNAPDNEQWRGVGLWPEAPTQLAFFYYTDVLTGKGDIAKIPIADYGITYDEATNSFSEFKLRMTFDNIEGTTDMKLTITINDKLAADTVLSEGQTYLGNRLHIWTNGGKTMSVRSVSNGTGGEEPGPGEGEEEPVIYREVTFFDFGLDDQVVPGNGQVSGVLDGAENLDGVAFTGYLQMGLMADGYHSFRIGGKEGDDNSRWSGVGLWTEAANQLSVFCYTAVPIGGTGADIVRLPIADYGITYDAENGYSEFKYRVTFDYVDGTNDIRITVSVNDKLAYDGVLNDAQEYFGNQMRIWAREDKSIVIRSDPDRERPAEKVDPAPVITNEFKQISFATYLFEAGTYGTAENPLSGHCRENSMDKVVFSDTLCFPEGGDVQWRFAGGESIWHGLMINVYGNALKLSNTVDGEWKSIIFDPKVAGCDLVGKDVKITISFEYVDCDEDGEKDDVKLGVWFNGKAYADRCFYLIGEAPRLGGYTMFYSPSGAHGITIDPYYPSLDFTIFGYTANWAKELGLK